MNADPICCPYCNSIVGPALTTSPRLTCPRCGEAFPNRSGQQAAASDVPVTDAPVNGRAFPKPLPTGPQWSNRAIARAVLGVMATMAVIGLAFALWTVQARRSQDFQSKATSPELVIRPVPPVELAGLGYLPPGTNLVAAVHVAEALRTPAGRAFLERSALAGTDFHMADLEKNVGIRRTDIDHVVFGVRLVDRQFPRVVLIVRTRQPYDADKVRAGLKAGRRIDVGKKEVYQFNLEKPRLSAFLWCAGPTTLVVGISDKDIEAVPTSPAGGVEQLAEPLQVFLKERLNVGTQAWVAGHAQNWDTVRLLATPFLTEDNQKLIARVETFGFWLRLDEKVEVRGAVRCTDAASAQSLEQALTLALSKENRYLNVLGSSPDAAKVAEELAKSLLVKQAENWVTLEAAASAETVKKAAGN